MMNAIMTVVHTIGAAVFVGSNVLLERLVRRLEAIPPLEAVRLSELLGVDMAVMNSAALVLLGLTGLWKIPQLGVHFGQLVDWRYVSSPDGLALVSMILLWVSLMVSSAFMMFCFRPRLLVKLPYNASRQAIDSEGANAMAAATWISRLSRFNLVAGVLALIAGAFLVR
jgi:hypothetical protein